MSEAITELGKKNPKIDRDAFHVAVMKVKVSGYSIRPGDKVKIKFGTNDTVIRADEDNYIGIIDPFIPENDWIEEDDEVLLWLKPGMVTGMQHRWECPAVDKTPEQLSASEEWLKGFADKWGFDYENMIVAASAGGDYIVAYGTDLHSIGELGNDYNLFWEHLEKVKGRKFDEEHRNTVDWGCSC